MIWTIFGVIGAINILTYILPWLYQTFFFAQQDLKKKYDAKWALVTGSSSGIGKAIAERLASQGISVVLVALPDSVFDKTFEELTKKYPKVSFVKCETDLSQGDYMSDIIKASKDLDINLVFNNAGYILPGFFHINPLDKSLRNFETNVTCGIKITHHFLGQMIAKKKKGFVCFTSSSSGFIVNPLSSIYSSTKCCLTNFAGTIAAEVKDFGIDVLVVHPSPIKSRFLENSNGFQVLDLSGKIASSPSVIADNIWACAGRCVVRDQGIVSLLLKIFVKVLDWNFLTDIIAQVAHTTGDYVRMKAEGEKNKKKQ